MGSCAVHGIKTSGSYTNSILLTTGEAAPMGPRRGRPRQFMTTGTSCKRVPLVGLPARAVRTLQLLCASSPRVFVTDGACDQRPPPAHRRHQVLKNPYGRHFDAISSTTSGRDVRPHQRAADAAGTHMPHASCHATATRGSVVASVSSWSVMVAVIAHACTQPSMRRRQRRCTPCPAPWPDRRLAAH